MSNDKYWDLFFKSGKIEQYLKYRRIKAQTKGSGYADTEGKSDSN